MPFIDRADAGRRLAERLLFLHGEDVVVLGLYRGGVPVAFEVARALDAPLDVIVVRKVGVPFQPELGMGAVAEGGVSVVNRQVVEAAGVSAGQLDTAEREAGQELERRAGLLRRGRPALPLHGRTAVVVDDGIATGSTARAACRSAHARGAERVILAVPVASPESIVDLGREVEVVCLDIPRDLWAVGRWYGDFSQVADDQVAWLLDEAAGGGGRAAARSARAPGPAAHPLDPAVSIAVGAGAGGERIELQGDLAVPAEPAGLVIFAHGSGSSRHSPRNRLVAARLNRDGLATLLFDLLTPVEELDRERVFDVVLLADRLGEVSRWARRRPETRQLPVGYFGASTGAAAALWAASEPEADVAAVVSRGGRPDLAGPRLAAVRAPTLLIVGGRDSAVLRLNRQAQERMVCQNRLAVVPGASHLFEEPGTLAAAAGLASKWLRDHLTHSRRPAA